MATNTMPAAKTIARPRISRPFAAWLGVNILDALLTYIMLGMGGIEGNPALSKLQGMFGPTGMLMAKLALSAAVGFALVMREKGHLLVLASRLMGLVVAYNTVVLAYYLLPSMGMPFTR
jgi:hypothetical protein